MLQLIQLFSLKKHASLTKSAQNEKLVEKLRSPLLSLCKPQPPPSFIFA